MHNSMTRFDDCTKAHCGCSWYSFTISPNFCVIIICHSVTSFHQLVCNYGTLCCRLFLDRCDCLIRLPQIWRWICYRKLLNLLGCWPITWLHWQNEVRWHRSIYSLISYQHTFSPHINTPSPSRHTATLGSIHSKQTTTRFAIVVASSIGRDGTRRWTTLSRTLIYTLSIVFPLTYFL